jgi:hypothetical protein
MDNSSISDLFATIVVCAAALGFLKLLIAVNRRHWNKEDEQVKLKLAVELFEGDQDAAQVWLSTPAKALGGLSPMQAKKTDVEDLIRRLEHGVYT